MPRKRKAPRLWLRKQRSDGTKSAWFIIDGQRQLGTGRAPDETAEAEQDLREYLQGNRRELAISTEINERFKHTRVGNVYFISCDIPDFPIKIGFAIDVRVRMRSLQGAMPWPLQLLLAHEGDVDKERDLHRRFKRHRMEGEWFARSSEILEYIDQVKTITTLSRKRRA